MGGSALVVSVKESPKGLLSLIQAKHCLPCRVFLPLCVACFFDAMFISCWGPDGNDRNVYSKSPLHGPTVYEENCHQNISFQSLRLNVGLDLKCFYLIWMNNYVNKSIVKQTQCEHWIYFRSYFYENEQNCWYDQYFVSQRSCWLCVIKFSTMWRISPKNIHKLSVCVCVCFFL